MALSHSSAGPTDPFAISPRVQTFIHGSTPLLNLYFLVFLLQFPSKISLHTLASDKFDPSQQLPQNSIKILFRTLFSNCHCMAVSLNFKIPYACKVSHALILICGGWELPTIGFFGLVIFFKVLSNILCLKKILLLFCVLWVIRCLAPSVESTISAQFNLKKLLCTWKQNGNKSIFANKQHMFF